MNQQEITCIVCPVGCRISVTMENDTITEITGYSCKRGEQYARQECTAPERMLTLVIPVEGSAVPLSVKTEKPVPKKDIPLCLAAIRAMNPVLPVQEGDVIESNLAGLHIRLIAGKSLPVQSWAE